MLYIYIYIARERRVCAILVIVFFIIYSYFELAFYIFTYIFI